MGGLLIWSPRPKLFYRHFCDTARWYRPSV